MAAPLPVVAVTGLLAEARIASGLGVATVAGGGDAGRLARSLRLALHDGVRAIISIGIAGGLHPDLRPGSVLVGRSISDASHRYPADPEWAARLEAALPDAYLADLAGVDRAVCSAAEKQALRSATGAAAVDMESHVVARFAALHAIPMAALRIVADPFDRAIPLAATVGMRPDGSTDVGAVLRALRHQPGALPTLVRTALDAGVALRALRRARHRLTPAFCFDGPRPAPGSPEAQDAGAGLRTPRTEIPAETA